MTINSEVRVAGPFQGNDVAVDFPFTFKVFDADEVLVVREEGGAELVLELGVDYTVALNVDQEAAPGGAVTLLAGPLPSGETLTLTSALAPLQPVDLTNQGGFYPRVINAALDRLTILVQQLSERLSRTLVVPISDGEPGGTLPSANDRKGTVLAFNEVTGAPQVGPTIAAVGTVAANTAAINTVADNIADVNTVATNVADVTNFAGVYYGPSATDPDTRRDGSPLRNGDLYFNISGEGMRVFDALAGWTSLPLSAGVSVSSYSGDGVQTSFELPYAPITERNTQVYISGVYQRKAEYMVSGDSLEFAVPPPVGVDNIEVVMFSVTQSDEGLRPDLASATDPAKGAGQVGYSGGLGYPAGSVGKALNIIKGKTVVIGEPGYTPVGNNIDAALSAAAASSAVNIIIPQGRFEITNTVRLRIGQSLRGEGGRFCRIVPKAGGDFAANGGRLIIANGKTTPSIDNTTWQVSLPNMMSGEITNIMFVNEGNIANLNGLLLFGSYICDELWFDNFRQAIARPAGLYVDSFDLQRVFVQKALENDLYQIDVQGLGDGFVMNGCHFPYDTANSRSTKAARLRGIHGGVVSHCIGGDYLVELCGNLNVVGGHFERAQHIYDSSSITVDSQFLPDTRIPIITRGTFASVGNESRFTVKLQNTKFRNIEGLMEWAGFHVQAAPSVTLDIENCSQEWTAQGDFQRAQEAGIRVCQEDGVSPVASFNNNSWLCSRRAVVEIPGAVNLNHGGRIADSTFPGISSSRVEAVGTRGVGVNQWLRATGTYFYQVQVLYDTTRAIGRNPVNAEVSLTATLGTMNILNIGFGTAPRNAIIRLYRGTSPGVYSEFVDVHTLGSTWLHDNGLRCNGISWQSRTPGAMNAINSMGSFIKFEGTLIELTAAALPNSAGSFTQGDRVKRTDGSLDGSNMLQIGHHRLTTGSGGVVGTDWAHMRVSHVSPAV